MNRPLAGTLAFAGTMLLASVGVVQDRTTPSPAKTPDTRMEWWREARLGMFIHWGLYAQPAGTWKEKRHGGPSEWLMDAAKIPPAEYERLAAGFNPVNFDAGRWVEIAKQAGMKYIVITSKHHDGFCLFDSALTDYDIMDATPFRRDVLKELSEACAEGGVRLCFYHSIMDWHHPLAKKETWPGYENHLRGQVGELLTNYGPIGVMWFDGEWTPEWTEAQGKSLYALCRDVQPNVIVNNRVGKGRDGMGGMSPADAPGDFGTPEQEVPGRGLPGMDWESCMTMNDSWGFKVGDNNWKSDERILRLVCETASKGGNLLLNVGPTAMGEIPPESVERLAKLGEWMAANGRAIYGTEAGPFRRVPWGYVTRRAGGARSTDLNLIIFDWPADGRLLLPGLRTNVLEAWWLRQRGTLGTEQTPDGVVVRLPPERPAELKHELASVVVLGVEGVTVETPPVRLAEGVYTLKAADADVEGVSARYEPRESRDCIGFWMRAEDRVCWEVDLADARALRVSVIQASDPKEGGGRYRVEIAGEGTSGTLNAEVRATKGWGDFEEVSLGSLAGFTEGRCKVSVIPLEKSNMALMNLRAIVLRPE